MATGKRSTLPARLNAAQHRFERWRKRRQGNSRIPEALWASAVKVAGEYGVHRTARTLHLEYRTLKRRVGAAGTDSPLDASLPAFVELAPRGVAGTRLRRAGPASGAG
ncbi:MAG: hypothetical protein ACE5F1_12875 [Planctomycetota bacterium]